MTEANVGTLAQDWSVDLGDDPMLDPAISQHGVHVVSGNAIRTLSMSDGSERWTSTIGQEGVSRNHEPSVFRREVLVGNDRSDGSDAGEGPHYWPAATGDFHGIYNNWVPTGPITVKGDVFAFTERQEDTPTGQVSLFVRYMDLGRITSWTSVLAKDGLATPPITSVSMSATHLAFGIGGDVLAFARRGPAECDWSTDPPRCEPEWRRTLGGTVTVPVFSDDEATLFAGDASGRVAALDATTGDTRWSADLGGREVVATPTLGDGLLYVPTATGDVFVYDADGCGAPSCSAIWTADTASPVREQAALAGGVFYVGSDDGTVRAYRASGCDAAMCDPIWQTSTGSAITGAPTVAQSALLVGTADGRLIAYRPS